MRNKPSKNRDLRMRQVWREWERKCGNSASAKKSLNIFKKALEEFNT